MNPGKMIRIALRSIARTKMRSMLTMLGIIIGVGAVICMVAIGQGAKSRIEQSILDLGVNMVVITPGASSSGGVSRGAGSLNRLQIADAEKLARESMLLSSVTPVIMTGGRIRGGGGTWRAPLPSPCRVITDATCSRYVGSPKAARPITLYSPLLTRKPRKAVNTE